MEDQTTEKRQLIEHSGLGSVTQWVANHIVATNLAFVLCYLIAALLGFQLAQIHDNVSPLWPPSGLVAAAMFLGGKRLLPGVFAGAFIANFLTPVSILTAGIVALGNTLEAIITLAFLGLALRLAVYLHDNTLVFWIAISAAFAPLPSTIFGSLAIFTTTPFEGGASRLWDLMMIWWIGNSVGLIVFTPLILFVKKPELSKEWFIKFGLYFAICAALFSLIFFHSEGQFLLFLALPLLLLASSWFGRIGCMLTTFGFVVFASFATELIHFNSNVPGSFDGIITIDIFIIAMAISSLVISTFKEVENPFIPAGLFMFGWVVSGTLYYIMVSNSKELDETRFMDLVGDYEYAVENRLQTYVDTLISAAGLYLNSEHVERSEWRSFVKQLNLQERYPGINGLGFILPFREAELEAYVRQTQQEGIKDFRIKTVPGVERPPPDALGYSHYIIAYIEPIETNREALGLDTASELNRQQAGAIARDTGSPTMTDRIKLVQDGQARPGFLIYYPMYREGTLTSVEERRDSFVGWSYAPFITELFFKGLSLNRSNQIDFAIFDSKTLDPENLVYTSSESVKNFKEEDFEHVSRIDLAGQTFTLGWVKGQQFVGQNIYPAIIAASSLILGICFLVGLVVNLQNTTRKSNRIVEEKTATLTQINEQLRHEVHERKKAQAKADEASRAKSDFLATMSHEIRTPLNSVLGFAGLLRESSLNNEQRIWTDLIQNSGQSLLRVINDILDFSKIEAGKLKLEEIPFSLQDTLHSTIESFHPMAGEKGVLVNYVEVGQVPKTLVGDPQRIRQVVGNLLSNAIKFTERGQVSLELSWENEAEGGRAMIRVVDTGIGIPEDELPHLFDEFTQADNSTTRRFGGTGLGLTICQRIVHLAGGKISVTSEEDVGTTFVVELPFREQSQGSKDSEIAPQEKAPDTPREKYDLEVLLVDDNRLNLRLAETILKRFGCKVTTAINGEEAIKRATSKKFDIAFVDCQMPVVDGYEATLQIRQIETSGEVDTLPTESPLFIVALTANASEEDRQRCLECGMNDYMRKPIQIKDFERILKQASGA